MIKKILYLYSKVVLRLQIPSVRESDIHKKASIGSRSNVIRLKMDKYSYLGNNSSVTDTAIGKYCSIASYCAIGGDSHPTNWVSTSPLFYSQKSSLNENFSDQLVLEQKKVSIKNDVWIGENCFIKGGVKIGNGAIVGAHSVVTRDIPDYAIVAGVPAKIIKYRFSEEVIEQLNEIQWWDLNESELKKYAHLFEEPKEFIRNFKRG